MNSSLLWKNPFEYCVWFYFRFFFALSSDHLTAFKSIPNARIVCRANGFYYFDSFVRSLSPLSFYVCDVLRNLLLCTDFSIKILYVYHFVLCSIIIEDNIRATRYLIGPPSCVCLYYSFLSGKLIAYYTVLYV